MCIRDRFEKTCASIERYRKMMAAKKTTREATMNKALALPRRGKIFEHFRVNFHCEDRSVLLRTMEPTTMNKLMAQHGGDTEEFWEELCKLSYKSIGLTQNRTLSWSLHPHQILPTLDSTEADQIEWRLMQERLIGDSSYFVPTREVCTTMEHMSAFAKCSEFQISQIWHKRLRSCVGVWVPQMPGIICLIDSFGRWSMRALWEHWSSQGATHGGTT
eukprot:TRINITY_DN2203_c0_g1_i5.p1 TRINITY_DN2203_c0_g1~~TRINITY_DN2203_c0_g1_i5.p1  ORF type:complete len:217 (-),score=19.82 TRINITY_DN2203_c0_g1_i5:61-711(-)